MPVEIWDAYLSDGSLVGCNLVRGEVIPEGFYHLVCEVLVRHTDGDYLLMQRDPHKPNYGGYYEATAGGSALKGEDKWVCVRRELWEETGLLGDSFLEIGRYLSRDTIYHAFLCTTDCDKDSVTLQEGETISYKWVPESEFIQFVNSDGMIDIQKVRYQDYFEKMGYLR